MQHNKLSSGELLIYIDSLYCDEIINEYNRLFLQDVMFLDASGDDTPTLEEQEEYKKLRQKLEAVKEKLPRDAVEFKLGKAYKKK
jgi:hypothetical protein